MTTGRHPTCEILTPGDPHRPAQECRHILIETERYGLSLARLALAWCGLVLMGCDLGLVGVSLLARLFLRPRSRLPGLMVCLALTTAALPQPVPPLPGA